MDTTATDDALDGPENERPPLSCDRIAGAALEFVGANCLGELSMRRLGAELGVEAMSLYRYFPSKASLLDAVVCRVLRDLELPDEAQSEWEPAVRAYARSYRSLARRHADLLPLLAAAGEESTTAAEVEGRMHELWRRAGLIGEDPRRAQRAIQAYVVGSSFGSDASPGQDDNDFELGLDALLEGLRFRLPSLRRDR